MGIFSKIADRVPRRVAVAMMAVAGLFGMRTPPDPPVTAQTSRWGQLGGGEPPDADRLRRLADSARIASIPVAPPAAPDSVPPVDARPMRRGKRHPRGRAPGGEPGAGS